MELKLGFRKYLEVWDREGGGRDVQLEGDMGKSMSDSYWCLVETNAIM